jgi:hypothetical protein
MSNQVSISNPLPPIKYVLYSHYVAHEKEDFETYKAKKEATDFDNLRGVVHLERHLKGLRELLNSPGHAGLLVLFYAPDKCFEKLLDGIRRGDFDHPNQRGPDLSLCFADEVAECVNKKLADASLGDRVRFLTPSDLLVILGPVNAIFAQHFREDMIGSAGGIRYDTPKTVEAILRLRLLGNGVPVLRMDHDVLFRFKENEKVIGDLGLFKAVACAVQAYQLRLAQPTVSTFLFSASYNSKALLDATQLKKDPFEAWSRAFATRIYPALKADPESIRRISGLPATQRNENWNDYVGSHLDDRFARQFYGLTNNPNKLETSAIEGLAAIGAHPLYAVISGALLCLSEGAILDLPPFSNFRNNVMWIDDHLKYSLHRAMHHFTSDEPLRLEEPGLSNARFEDVSVTKARPPVGNLPAYIFGIYLPTLLWGAIMDAWITKDSILKYRMGALDPQHEELWRNAKVQQDRAPQAPLPEAMLKALSSGQFLSHDQEDLGIKLDKFAFERIEMVRQLWAKLKNGGEETFASYWVQGRVKEVFGEECFNKCTDRLWEGMAPGRPLNRPIANSRELDNSDLSDKYRELREDAIAYVHWTRRWPNFVQIVRSIRQGDFMGDLGWKPEKP